MDAIHQHLIEIELPFWGFYESIHDSIIDDHIRGYFMDDDGSIAVEAEEAIWDADINWDKLRREYCQAFVYNLASELSYPGKYSVDMEFADLVSPQFYNYSSDRLFATIPADQLAKIRAEVEGYDDGERWRQKVEDTFTSYDGFSSNYPSQITAEEWTRQDWDAVQYMPLMELYFEEEIGEHWQSDMTEGVMDNETQEFANTLEKIESKLEEEA